MPASVVWGTVPPAMHTVTLEHARAHFDALLDEAVAGEEIVIEDSRRPVVRLVPAVPHVARQTQLAEWLSQARQLPAPEGLSTEAVLSENRSEI